jgi:hypothetical protein
MFVILLACRCTFPLADVNGISMPHFRKKILLCLATAKIGKIMGTHSGRIVPGLIDIPSTDFEDVVVDWYAYIFILFLLLQSVIY